MWNLKKKIQNELIYKREIHSQPYKTNLWLLKGKGGEINWEFGINRYILLYKIDKQQGPNVYHRELYSVSCKNL